jgi:hypothetical protein
MVYPNSMDFRSSPLDPGASSHQNLAAMSVLRRRHSIEWTSTPMTK